MALSQTVEVLFGMGNNDNDETAMGEANIQTYSSHAVNNGDETMTDTSSSFLRHQYKRRRQTSCGILGQYHICIPSLPHVTALPSNYC
jgi:hypothetical protein